MRMTAKEFAITQNMSLITVKRYCKQGIFKHHRIGRTYNIDVEYAISALARLDEQQHVLDTPIKHVEQNHHTKIHTEKDFLNALRALKKEA